MNGVYSVSILAVYSVSHVYKDTRTTRRPVGTLLLTDFWSALMAFTFHTPGENDGVR